MDPRCTVRPVAFLVALLDFLQQLCVRLRSGRRGSLEPRIVSAGRDSQHSTLRGNLIFGLMSLRELEPPDGIEPVSRANQAVAFAKISRSSFTCRSSRFSRLSSSRSGVVRPSLRRPSSRSARSAHFRIVVAVGSNSFANCSGLRPARTNSTIWFRNSTGYGFLVPPTVTPPLPQSGSIHQLGARSLFLLGGKGLGSAGGECRILERSMCLRMR